MDRGRPGEGLAIRGVLPVPYRNSTFNIPIQVCYYDGYPSTPPVAMVTPTPDMMIKANEYVREDGVVMSQIVKQWNVQCNTKVLLDDMIALFGYKMPVFARPAGAAQPVQYNNRPQPAAPQPVMTQPTMPTSNLAVPLREQYEIRASELISELEILEKDRAGLMQSAEQISQAKKILREEQAQANGRLAAMEQAKGSVSQWISANSNIEVTNMPLDQLLPRENPLSSGLLLALAREQAYEESANALVEGFGMRRCSTEDFIRSLKGLYRDEFMELQKKERTMQLIKQRH